MSPGGLFCNFFPRSHGDCKIENFSVKIARIVHPFLSRTIANPRQYLNSSPRRRTKIGHQNSTTRAVLSRPPNIVIVPKQPFRAIANYHLPFPCISYQPQSTTKIAFISRSPMNNAPIDSFYLPGQLSACSGSKLPKRGSLSRAGVYIIEAVCQA